MNQMRNEEGRAGRYRDAEGRIEDTCGRDSAETEFLPAAYISWRREIATTGGGLFGQFKEKGYEDWQRPSPTQLLDGVFEYPHQHLVIGISRISRLELGPRAASKLCPQRFVSPQS